MIKPEQIPDEAWRAAMKTDPREGLAAAIAAALNAWPRAQESGMTMGKYKTHIYILPLPGDEA